MIRTIVVPLDGSPLAARALPYAKTLAGTNRARLVLLQVARPVREPAGEGEHRAATDEANAYLAAVAQDLAPPGTALDVAIAVAYGDPGEAILKEASRASADLVVMG